MAVIQETIPAGNLIYRKITGRKQISSGQGRAKKNHPTIEAVEKNNQRYAERDLILKINHNYEVDDYHIVFTYRGDEPTKEEAWEHLRKFKRALLALYRKNSLVLKWIEATEYKNQRIHHHFILNKGVDLSEITSTWGHGKILVTPLYQEGNYRELAAYLIKETSKTIKSDDPFGRKRFRCSRTIKNPPVFREEVKLSKLLDDPKPIKGYYIDQDSIVKGVNPVTERQYIDFYMIAIEGEEQAKKIHGKKVSYRKDSADWWLKKHADKQIKMDYDLFHDGGGRRL